MTEGTFYNRSIAVRLSRVLDTSFDEDDGDCLDSFMSVSEAFLLQILQNACVSASLSARGVASDSPADPQLVSPKFNATDAALLMQELSSAHCGDKTGAVSWLNRDWAVTENDVMATRCSPFQGSFSLNTFFS
jgi:hypothetical protein